MPDVEPVDAQLTQYIIEVLFRGWDKGTAIVDLVSTIGFLAAPFINSSWPLSRSIGILLAIVVVSFIVKLIRQGNIYFQGLLRPIKALSLIQGDGIFAGHLLVILQNSSSVDTGQVLTLYCSSSGARQRVAMLEIVDKNEKELLCRQFPSDVTDVSKFFNEESRRKATFALPLLKANYLTSLFDKKGTSDGP